MRTVPSRIRVQAITEARRVRNDSRRSKNGGEDWTATVGCTAALFLRVLAMLTTYLTCTARDPLLRFRSALARAALGTSKEEAPGSAGGAISRNASNSRAGHTCTMIRRLEVLNCQVRSAVVMR